MFRTTGRVARNRIKITQAMNSHKHLDIEKRIRFCHLQLFLKRRILSNCRDRN